MNKISRDRGIVVNGGKMKKLYNKIITELISVSDFDNFGFIKVANSLRELSGKIKMNFKTVRNYVEILKKLGLIHVNESNQTDWGFPIMIDVCNIVKAHFLMNLEEFKCSLIRNVPLFRPLLDNNCDLEEFFKQLGSNWSAHDDIFILSYHVNRRLLDYGVKLRSLGRERERLYDLVDYNPRIKVVVEQLCRWYLGEPVIVDYVSRESKKIDLKKVFVSVLDEVNFDDIRFKPLWKEFEKSSMVKIDLEWREVLDRNLYILIYRSLKQNSFRSVRTSGLPLCAMDYYKYFRDSVSVFVGLALVLGEYLT